MLLGAVVNRCLRYVGGGRVADLVGRFTRGNHCATKDLGNVNLVCFWLNGLIWCWRWGLDSRGA